MMEPLIVTIQDARDAGFCVNRLRGWGKLHGLDFRDFVQNGIDAERLRATGDGLADKVIAVAQARANG